ncbi:hypothetical protein CBS101457_004677 [Exobasidium rhododendri]|nr:hypothetical protein CBS101457_004677 [Exobasidium rhododendri]
MSRAQSWSSSLWQKRRKSHDDNEDQSREGDDGESHSDTYGEEEGDEDDEGGKEDQSRGGGDRVDYKDGDDWKDDSDKHNKSTDERDAESSTSAVVSTTSSSELTSYSTWSSEARFTSASQTPLPTSWSASSVAVPLLPASAPASEPTLAPQRVSLITNQVIKARQRAVEASHSTADMSDDPSSASLAWKSPQPGDAFAAGDEIMLHWTLPSSTGPSFQLRLCVLRASKDLQSAHSGSFGDGACGTGIQVNNSSPADETAGKVSFDAPTVSNADSFFIVLSPAQLVDASGPKATLPSSPTASLSLVPPSETANWASLDRQKRDMPPMSQLISPPFVLAPRGVNLAMMDSIPIATDVFDMTKQTPQSQRDQKDNATDSERARPISWGYVVGPILIVLTITVICGLIVAHRRGKKAAQEVATLQAREGEEKWRESTRREVEQLAKSTASQADRSVVTPHRNGGRPTLARNPFQSLDRRVPQSVDHYTVLPSKVSHRRQGSTSSASSYATSSRPASEADDHYAMLPSDLGYPMHDTALPSRDIRRSTTLSYCASSEEDDLDSLKETAAVLHYYSAKKAAFQPLPDLILPYRLPCDQDP